MRVGEHAVGDQLDRDVSSTSETREIGANDEVCAYVGVCM